MNNASTTYLTLRGLEGHAPVTRTDVQIALAPHVELIATLWWIVFALSLVTVLYLAFRSRAK